MNKTNLKKYICTAMAAIMAVCMTSCGEVNNSPAAGGEETTAVTSEATTEIRPDETTAAPDVQPDVPDETRPGDVQPDVSYAPAVLDKYSDADYIEAIADDRYLVMYQTSLCKGGFKTIVDIYDSASDTVVNSFDIPDTLTTPEIYYGRGFGFISEGQDKSLRDPDAEWTYTEAQKTFFLKASYYDINGDLVNEFKKFGADEYSCSYTFAPDGSAFYVAQDDRQQCACGYDFNPDFTTKITAVYGDGTSELITEFDSHTILSLIGATDDGRIAVYYSYNPEDLKVYSHDEYESHSISGNKNSEKGIAFISTEAGSAPELDRAYQLEDHYNIHMDGDKFTLLNDNEIMRIFPDEKGEYQSTHFEIAESENRDYSEKYISPKGNIIVYPTFVDENDTIVNVVYFDSDNQPKQLFEQYCEGMRVEFQSSYGLAMFDDRSGELVGTFKETTGGGSRKQVYRVNIYKD